MATQGLLTVFVIPTYPGTMATLNISLPDSMRAFVDSEVASGDYGTASAYMQQLIRRDKRRAEVRQMILDGIASESVGEFDDAFRQEMRERASGK
jgi:antitoxin ParD1/3/4